jgi:hypothetical protein
MRSRSARGTFVRQPFLVQTYFGVFPGKYIFAPQWQKVRPPKICTARLGAALVPLPRFSARRAFAAFHKSSGTIASTGISIQSVSGFRFQPLPWPRDLV